MSLLKLYSLPGSVSCIFIRGEQQTVLGIHNCSCLTDAQEANVIPLVANGALDIDMSRVTASEITTRAMINL